VDDLSNWYVRLSRRRFWEGDRAAFATLRHCLLTTSALLAPFVPFLADELYANLVGGDDERFEAVPDSIHLTDFPEPDAALADRGLEAGVEAALRAVELGRAARAHAKVKMRQPLRKAVIVARGAEREEIERLTALVAGELNVKELEFVSEEAELVRYDVKPNYRSLGPRFGKQMPKAAAAVEALDPGSVTDAIAGARRIGINVDGTEHELQPEDVTLVMRPLDGYRVVAEAGRAVALSLELDEELRREGLAREIVHAVQNARRDAGLDVTDRIELVLGGDAELLDAARAHEAYLAGETLATSVGYDGDSAAATKIEGRDLRIGVERAG
jgi:isoleucyl-tRNA synthetase